MSLITSSLLARHAQQRLQVTFRMKIMHISERHVHKYKNAFNWGITSIVNPFYHRKVEYL